MNEEMKEHVGEKKGL